MSNDERDIEETLWSYIDGNMLPDGRSHIEQLIELDATWRAKYADLLEVHSLMKQSIELDEPSLRFTQNVMEEISRLYITPATTKYINKNIIWGIMIFFLTTIISLVVYGLGQTNWTEASTLPGMDKLDTVSRFDWTKLYNNSYTNIIVLVNIMLGLMMLDMYLSKRKREHQAVNP